MGKILAVNHRVGETRVALASDGVLQHVFVERDRDRGTVGNIYRGRIQRVLPGMQAAFVDVGLHRTGFLYGGDAQPPVPRKEAGEERDVEPGDDGSGEASGSDEQPRPSGDRIPIEQILRPGQVVTCQISKDPIQNKGARLTLFPSLPGRFLVYLPRGNHVGVSRRITDEAENERLREAVSSFSAEDEGFIVRTAAEGATVDELAQDAETLRRTWRVVSGRIDRAGNQAPVTVWEDLDLVSRCIRDLADADLERIVVDDAAVQERIREFVGSAIADLDVPVELYEGKQPLMVHLNLEPELNRIMDRKVWLPSGGFLVIDQSEALTSIDVNSGRYVGSSDLEETVTAVNIEACREISRILRVRDIGGIIVIDFIDMKEEDNRLQVQEALAEALANDRARTTVLPISGLGLVEMTRKRVREDVVKYLGTGCPTCGGRGYVKSALTMCFEVARQVERAARRNEGAHKAVVGAHPSVIDTLHSEMDLVQDLESRLGISVHLRSDPALGVESCEVSVE